MLGHSHHDHDHCREGAVQRVEARCDALGLRLTAQRRQVLDVLLASHVPVTAYEIIDRIGAKARRPSPVSVYRALEFLVANRFVHRIESRNAFLACSHEHDEAAAGGNPMLVFLLCEACGAAAEAEPPALAATIANLAGGAGFTVSAAVLELRGLCAACRSAGRTLDTTVPAGEDA